MDESRVKVNSKEYFDSIAGNYDKSHDGKYVNCTYEEVISRVLAMKERPKKILDLGCGNGNVLKLLSERIDAQLYGLDLSENMIEEAKVRLEGNAELIVGDAELLPYNNKQFDLVICNASFHHYPNPKAVLSEIKRVLRNGGTLILGDPTAPTEWYRKALNVFLRYSNSGDYHIYGKKDITDILMDTGFTVDSWKRLEWRTFVLNAVSI